ncbi:hypothetical protein [Rhizobium mesosinicum]|uniref:DUF4440 domain-containing protein n=1 Tax=Rhizobium mesosinicum TaxID=335017 RepID=A0ABS7H3W5_9HYPH|nr:hypothetical protein [Rhizobium mesosinicum]MBW9056263.1 hypothetical protein [Rhizobium mesosinicum]
MASFVLAGLALVKSAFGIAANGRHSSIWRRTGEGWKIAFHQGAPIS